MIFLKAFEMRIMVTICDYWGCMSYWVQESCISWRLLILFINTNFLNWIAEYLVKFGNLMNFELIFLLFCLIRILYFGYKVSHEIAHLIRIINGLSHIYHAVNLVLKLIFLLFFLVFFLLHFFIFCLFFWLSILLKTKINQSKTFYFLYTPCIPI